MLFKPEGLMGGKEFSLKAIVCFFRGLSGKKKGVAQ